jgi:hypothetical protein
MYLDRVHPLKPAVFGLFALASIGLLSAPAPARCQEDTNTFNSMLGFFGLQFDKEEEAIDYHARPPLVVPPDRQTLPEPKEASHAPNWPKDPDAAERRRAALDSKRPAPIPSPNSRVELSPQELEGGQGGSVNTKPADECQATSGTWSCIYAPWKLLETAFGGGKSDKVEPGVEPPRRYLTEPPLGYRSATKSMDATSEAPAVQPDAADAGAYIRSQRQ